MTKDELRERALQTLREFRHNCYADQDAFRTSRTDDEEREAEENAAAHNNQALNAILALIDQAKDEEAEAVKAAYRELADVICGVGSGAVWKEHEETILPAACKLKHRGQAQVVPVEPSEDAVERIFQELDGTFEGSRLSAGNLEVLICKTLLLAARPVSVTGKALDWDCDAEDESRYVCGTPVGILNVWNDPNLGAWRWSTPWSNDRGGWGIEDTRKLAQTAGEKDYRSRVKLAASIAEVSHD